MPILAPHALPPSAPLLAESLTYAQIVGSFERRNCAVQTASAVESYFLEVDDMDESEHKAQVSLA